MSKAGKSAKPAGSKASGDGSGNGIVWLDPYELLNFHLQQEIFGAEDISQDFLESLAHGIEEPLIVHEEPDGTFVTLAGHRRKNGARLQKIKRVPCIVRRGLTEAEKTRIFLASNKQREKTKEQVLREAAAWEKIFAVEATEREKAGTLAPRGARGKAAEKAAEVVGVPARTIERAKPVIAAIDKAEAAGDHQAAEVIRETLDSRGVEPARKVAEAQQAPAAKPSGGNASDLRDQCGCRVPESLRPYFERSARLTAEIQALGKVTSRVEQVFEGTNGVGPLRVDTFADLVNRAQQHLQLNRPHTTCPACDIDKPSKSCRRCDGRGWITRSEYGQLPKDLLAKLEERK